MRRRKKDEAGSNRFVTDDAEVIDLLKRSAGDNEKVSPGEALTLEQTVEVLQRLRSRQRPGSAVSLYLDTRHGL